MGAGAVGAGVYFTGSVAALSAVVMPVLPVVGIAVADVAGLALVAVAAIAIARRVSARKSLRKPVAELQNQQAKAEVDALVGQAVAQINACETPAELEAYRGKFADSRLCQQLVNPLELAKLDFKDYVAPQLKAAHEAKMNTFNEEVGQDALRTAQATVTHQQEASPSVDERDVFHDASNDQDATVHTTNLDGKPQASI